MSCSVYLRSACCMEPYFQLTECRYEQICFYVDDRWKNNVTACHFMLYLDGIGVS